MKFKKGDKAEVESKLGWTVGEIMAIDGEMAWMKLDEHTYESAKLSSLNPFRETQNWFGIEIDAFDTELPEEGEKYCFYNPANSILYNSCYYADDNNDGRVMPTGYWLDVEKAKRSAPKMYKRMCEMAKVRGEHEA